MNLLTCLAIVLGIIVVILAAYILGCQRQLRSINRQLEEKMAEDTAKPLSLELMNRELIELGANINRCFEKADDYKSERFREELLLKELISNISHDLRTPLTVIKGYLQLVEKEGLSSNQSLKLKTAQKYSDELSGLVDRLFEYTYLLSAQPSPVLERINLRELVAEIIAESITILEEKEIEINICSNQSVYAMADKKMLIRIIQNLIQNCAAHSDGNVEVQIYAEEKAVLVFSNPVSSSHEIDESQLFDRFYTSDNSRQKGTGLGLSIVKILVQQQGGIISASIRDGFFEVKISLPRFKE